MDYDRRRQDNRMALNQLNGIKDKKVWMYFGDLILRLPKKKVENMIKKEQEQLDIYIKETRESIHEKTTELESHQDLSSFKLKPMSNQDLTWLTGEKE